MDTSSEYTFPIFISSTDYNLKDFRAELARFLTELGYRPILSSAEGFHDKSPKLEPWESCLPVLEQTFVVVLVIDGYYGIPMTWPNFQDLFDNQKYSPTHGEYIFAHHRLNKRMLVFIRRSLMPHYQSFRKVLNGQYDDLAKSKEILEQTLPDYVSFDSLNFIHKVKTTKPIPWIVEFDDITDVKTSIQKKMLNELAEIFLIKKIHYDTVIESFNKLLASLSPEEQKKALTKIDATKEIIDSVDKLEELKVKLEKSEEELSKAVSTNSADKTKFEFEIKGLKGKIQQLEEESLNSSDSQFYINNGQVKIGNPNFDSSSFTNIKSGFIASDAIRYALGTPNVFTIPNKTGRKCDQCEKEEELQIFKPALSGLFDSGFKTCPQCNRYLCSSCWPRNSTISAIAVGQYYPSKLNDDKCPKCASQINN